MKNNDIGHIEFENCNSVPAPVMNSCLDKLVSQGITLKSIQAIWFQMNKNLLFLEMCDGSRKTVSMA